MEYYFQTVEEAAIFAGSKQGEGYFAAVLDDHVSSLWGPLATGGVRVTVSDTTGENQIPLSPDGAVVRFLRLLATLVFSVAILWLLADLGLLFVTAPVSFAILLVLLGVAIIVYLIVMSFLAFVLSIATNSWRLPLDQRPTSDTVIIAIISVLLGGLMLILGPA